LSLSVQPVRVATREEGNGLLVFDDGSLVAVLVQLSEIHEDDAGKWFLEAGFGKLNEAITYPIFPSLEGALDFVGYQLGHARSEGPAL